ncbi:hypothetical protein [Helicobacter pylori]|uniref:hypothetical protein n=1 Tax=Helicobacter pylori TaxID=210 RepID=UPI001BB30602|nr:hypothetical protein [Helicobacter pylori]
METFFNIKKGLKSGLIGIAVKMEIHLLGGIVLDLAVKLKGGFWNNIPTRFLITLKKPPLKSSFFHFVMKRPNTRDIWDFCLGGFKGDFIVFTASVP